MKNILVAALFAAACVASVNAMHQAGSYESQHEALHGRGVMGRHHRQEVREERSEHSDPFASGHHSLR